MNRIPLRQLTGLLVGFILLCCMGDLQAIPRGKCFQEVSNECCRLNFI